MQVYILFTIFLKTLRNVKHHTIFFHDYEHIMRHNFTTTDVQCNINDILTKVLIVSK